MVNTVRCMTIAASRFSALVIICALSVVATACSKGGASVPTPIYATFSPGEAPTVTATRGVVTTPGASVTPTSPDASPTAATTPSQGTPTPGPSPTPSPTLEPCISSVSVPAGLPQHFALGLGNQPEDIRWMTDSGIPWDFRYQYLTGNVTEPVDSWNRWTTWNLPAGQFATYYIERSHEAGYIPVFTYYTLVSSSPNAWSENPKPKLESASTMRGYFEDWKLLMVKAGESGETVVVHHEPDAWGFIQHINSDPDEVYVAVEDSGFGEVSGFANNASGFAKALVALRDEYAPNVVLAWHASHWANRTDFTHQDSLASPQDAAEDVAAFYNALDADFDLIFTDPSDRDWGYLLTVENEPQHEWTDETFSRLLDFVSTLHDQTGLPLMLWQVPIGNTIYRSVNNTNGHYQDNHVQYFLAEGNREHIKEFAKAGVIGILFGRGNSAQTTYLDDRRDGVTNPEPVNGNDQWAEHSDDDGGFLRLRGEAYYESGTVRVGCEQRPS